MTGTARTGSPTFTAHPRLPPFFHVILTRFNVGLDATTREGDAWLRERVALFETFTLPSMVGQSRPPDAWILFCDSTAGSPDWFRERALRYERQGIIVEWVAEFSLEQCRRAILHRVPAHTPWLLSTRLDNDDAIARDFVLNIQRHFRLKREVLNFTVGLQYAGRRIYWRIDPRGPFTTLVERAGNHISTVFAEEHSHLDRVAPVRQIRMRPMWLQVIHGRNLGNLIAGIEGPSSGALRAFDVPFHVEPVRVRGVVGSAWAMVRKVAARPSRWLRLLQSAAR